MLIQILPDGEYLSLSKEAPVVGRTYSLEDAENGTGAQGRAWHALVQEYWRVGGHSYQARDFLEFRNCLKRALGAGFEAYVYAEIVGGNPIFRDAKTYEEIPKHIRTAPNRRDIIRGRLKSWSDYRKSERQKAIDLLIADMIQNGVDSKKFHEILDGLEAARKAREGK